MTCTFLLCCQPSKFAPPAIYKLRLLFRAIVCLFRILPPLSKPLDFFYFLETVVPASIDAGAFSCRFVPVARPAQVARPERPASALARPDRINRTLPSTSFALQEYTVFCQMVLNNRRSKPDTLEIFLPELSYCHFQKISNYFNLRLRHPDIPLPGPGAAPPTPLALKMQAGNIPFSIHLRQHLTT